MGEYVKNQNHEVTDEQKNSSKQMVSIFDMSENSGIIIITQDTKAGEIYSVNKMFDDQFDNWNVKGMEFNRVLFDPKKE